MCRSRAHDGLFVTSFSNCFLSPGHHTDDLNCNRLLSTPWWPPCNMSNISILMQLGITNVTPFNKSPCWTISSFWTCQYGFRVPGRERKVGHPSKQYVITWRYTASSRWHALISANLVTVAGICPMTRFVCSETSTENCDSSAVSGRTEGERDRASAATRFLQVHD